MNHVFCELLSPSGASPEEQLRPARIDFGLASENGSLLLKLSYGNGDFVVGLGGGQEAPRKGKRTKRILRELILATRKCCKKRSFDGSRYRTLCFMCFFLSMFPKPNFLHVFREKSAVQAAIHWATARPNQAKTTAKTQGFGNWLLKTIVKNPGSASVECANLVFCGVFLSLT